MTMASKYNYHSVISICSIVPLTILGLIACGDSPANDAPTVIGANTSALCALRDGADALSEVQFVIEDLQGSDTLLSPYVAYRTISIPMTETIIPAASAEEIATAKAEGQPLNSCSKESCQIQYSWTYDRNDEQSGLLRCDENSQIEVIIKDINNNEKEFKIFVQNEE